MSRDWCTCDHPQPQPAEGESYWICGECGDFTQDPTTEARLSQAIERMERAAEGRADGDDRRQAVPDERDWITATEVARGLGVRRDYVYEHKAQLGGKPLGTGPRPRWRFPASVLTPPEVVEGNGSPKTEDGRDQETRP